MHEKALINNLACGSKLIIHTLNWKPEDRIFAEGIIDIIAESLKFAVSVKDAEIERIKAAARLYNLDRVVVFPCFIGGEIQLCYRMYGGYIPMFCQYLGIHLLADADVQLNTNYISKIEQQYGVVLYEK